MQISSLVDRLKEVPQHFVEGSISHYVNQEWQKYQHRRSYRTRQQRIVWWMARSGSEGSVDVEIQPDIFMHLNFDSQLCQFLYTGNFEISERSFFNAYLRSGDTVLDAGANIGLFTLIAAKLVGLQGSVHSFEPVNQVYKRLQKNIALNHLTNVTAHQIALSDETAQSQITIALDGYDAWNSLAQPTAGNSFNTEAIQAVRIDDFIAQQHSLDAIALMKIDVEGWESHLLEGGKKLFSGADAPTLLIEFTEINCQAAQSSCRILYRQLEAYGYSLFVYDSQSVQLVAEPIQETYEYVNLIATKDMEFVQKRLDAKISPAWMK